MAANTASGKREAYIIRNRDRGCTVAAQVVLAGTSRERRQGLKHKDISPGNWGLWIAPCEAIHTFGMRGAIDVVFLDKHFCVRKVQSGLQPRKLAFCLRAHSVLELPSGSVAQSGIFVGDHLEFLLHARKVEVS